MCPCNFRPTQAEAVRGRAETALWCCCRALRRALLALLAEGMGCVKMGHVMSSTPVLPPACLVISQSCLNKQSPSSNVLDIFCRMFISLDLVNALKNLLKRSEFVAATYDRANFTLSWLRCCWKEAKEKTIHVYRQWTCMHRESFFAWYCLMLIRNNPASEFEYEATRTSWKQPQADPN